MQLRKDGLWLFDRQLADGAIGAVVNFLDEVCALRNVTEIGVEFDSVFHFFS